MTQTATYISAPGEASPWTVSLTHRRDGLTLTERAESGQVGTGTFLIDDDAGTAGHSSDGIVGLKGIKFEQSACSVARTFSGFIAERMYHRGDQAVFSSSTYRQIDVSVVDLNAKAGFMRITGADGNRPSETVSTRLAWILGSSYVGTLFTANASNESSSVVMTANDYRHSTPGDVIADCAMEAKGFNWFIKYNPGTDADELYFLNSNTSTTDTSSIKISNVAADVDSTAVFAPQQDWTLRRTPDRVVAGVDFMYAKGTTYQTRAATAQTYAWRDGVAPTSTVKSLTNAVAIAQQFLWQNHTEEDRLTVRIRMRAAYVNLIRPGQRMQVKLSNVPEYASYTWFRVMARTVTQPLKTDNDYDVELELSPQESGPPNGLIVQELHEYIGGVSATVGFTSPITPGSLLVVVENRWKGNGTDPVSPNVDSGAGDCIGGTGAWTLSSAGVVKTATSGDRSHVAMWYKTATSSQQSGPVFSAFTWVDMYELANVTATGMTIVHQDVPGSSSNWDVGSLGSPASGDISIMVTAGYCNLCGDVGFSPTSDWVTDQSYGNTYFSSRQPYYVAHSLGDGTSTEATVGASVSMPWCGIAAKFPAV